MAVDNHMAGRKPLSKREEGRSKYQKKYAYISAHIRMNSTTENKHHSENRLPLPIFMVGLAPEDC